MRNANAVIVKNTTIKIAQYFFGMKNLLPGSEYIKIPTVTNIDDITIPRIGYFSIRTTSLFLFDIGMVYLYF